ncbi:MAG: hypothetical protein U0263_38435 [Polyangiaceae bacterium]
MVSAALATKTLLPASLGLGLLVLLPLAALASASKGRGVLARALLFAAYALVSRWAEIPAVAGAALAAEGIGRYLGRATRALSAGPRLTWAIVTSASVAFALAFVTRVGVQRGPHLSSMDFASGTFDSKHVAPGRVGVCLALKYGTSVALVVSARCAGCRSPWCGRAFTSCAWRWCCDSPPWPPSRMRRRCRFGRVSAWSASWAGGLDGGGRGARRARRGASAGPPVGNGLSGVVAPPAAASALMGALALVAVLLAGILGVVLAAPDSAGGRALAGRRTGVHPPAHARDRGRAALDVATDLSRMPNFARAVREEASGELWLDASR